MSVNGRRLILGAVMTVIMILVVWIAAATVGTDRTIANLGDDRFGDVRAAQVLTDVAEGGPIFYPDLTNGSRDIWITHVGDDPALGYLVLSALAPSGCLIQWDRGALDFFDICDETSRYTPDSSDLDRYPVELSDGKLIIDLNFDSRP